MLFVNNCTFILFNKNEIIYHQETSMLRSLSTDTITSTTNQPDKETTFQTNLVINSTGPHIYVRDPMKETYILVNKNNSNFVILIFYNEIFQYQTIPLSLFN